jgi:hypothetical protein
VSLLKPAILLSAGLGLSGVAHAAGDKPVPFLAHRAVYELTLAKAVGNKSPISARGRIVYEFTGSTCEGYVTNFRQVTELQPEEGGSRLSDMRSHTFEDAAAKNFSFKIETSVDDTKRDDLDGTATRANDGALAIDLSRPKPEKIGAGPGVVFPTEHLERIIAAAKAGEHTLAVKSYDGSDTGSKIYDTFTVIGKPSEGVPEGPAEQVDALKSVRRWPVAVSYFDNSKVDGPPSYVLSFDLFENGVSGALKLDYGDFTLAGKMSKFEPLPEVACSK